VKNGEPNFVAGNDLEEDPDMEKERLADLGKASNRIRSMINL
jgi:hypothetical protein